jgi:hypothetical protein
MEIIYKEMNVREKNVTIDLIKQGESVIFIVGNSIKELNSFVNFMNRLKKSNVKMSVRVSMERDSTDNK